MADKFIPGIYNYCDRWCERCPLTARCRVFAMEEARKCGDQYYAAFWKSFDDLAEQEADEWENDDTELEDEQSILQEQTPPDGDDWDDDDELELGISRDPIVTIAMDYARDARQWLMQNVPDEQKSTTTESKSAPPQDIGSNDALDILHWYVHQIAVKLTRSLRGAIDVVQELDLDDDAEVDDEIRTAMAEAAQQDRDGSAKVALIGIERSLGAWTILRDEFTHQNQAILGFQRSLARLRRLVDERIPGARVFQRPGFDYEA